MKAVYLSEFVIGKPDGPGVNEHEFSSSLLNIDPEVSVDIIAIQNSQAKKKNRMDYAFRQLSLISALLVLALKKRNKVDVVIARSGPLPVATLLASILLNCPVYIKTAGDGRFAVLSGKSGLVYRALYWLCRKLWGALLKRTLAVDVVSRSHASGFSSNLVYNPTNIHIIDNGVNTDFFQKSGNLMLSQEFLDWKARFKVLVGYIGGYPLVRGGGHLLELYKELESRDAGIVIIGGEKEEVSRHAMNLGCSDAWITGQIPYKDVPAYMAALDIGVSILEPSAWGASEQKLRQYLSSELVAVCTPASNDELIKAGVVVPALSDSRADVLSAIDEALQKVNDEEFRFRARKYAVDRLSVNSRTARRLEIIRKSLKK